MANFLFKKIALFFDLLFQLILIFVFFVYFLFKGRPELHDGHKPRLCIDYQPSACCLHGSGSVRTEAQSSHKAPQQTSYQSTSQRSTRFTSVKAALSVAGHRVVGGVKWLLSFIWRPKQQSPVTEQSAPSLPSVLTPWTTTPVTTQANAADTWPTKFSKVETVWTNRSENDTTTTHPTLPPDIKSTKSASAAFTPYVGDKRQFQHEREPDYPMAFYNPNDIVSAATHTESDAPATITSFESSVTTTNVLRPPLMPPKPPAQMEVRPYHHETKPPPRTAQTDVVHNVLAPTPFALPPKKLVNNEERYFANEVKPQAPPRFSTMGATPFYKQELHIDTQSSVPLQPPTKRSPLPYETVNTVFNSETMSEPALQNGDYVLGPRVLADSGEPIPEVDRLVTSLSSADTFSDKDALVSHDHEEKIVTTVAEVRRQWPPPSNATGAEIVKDLWIPTVPKYLTDMDDSAAPMAASWHHDARVTQAEQKMTTSNFQEHVIDQVRVCQTISRALVAASEADRSFSGSRGVRIFTKKRQSLDEQQKWEGDEEDGGSSVTELSDIAVHNNGAAGQWVFTSASEYNGIPRAIRNPQGDLMDYGRFVAEHGSSYGKAFGSSAAIPQTLVSSKEKGAQMFSRQREHADRFVVTPTQEQMDRRTRVASVSPMPPSTVTPPWRTAKKGRSVEPSIARTTVSLPQKLFSPEKFLSPAEYRSMYNATPKPWGFGTGRRNSGSFSDLGYTDY